MSRRSSGPAPTPSPSSRPSARRRIPRRRRGASSRRSARPARAPPGERSLDHTSPLPPARRRLRDRLRHIPAGPLRGVSQLGRRRQLPREPQLPRARLGEPALDVHRDARGALDPALVAHARPELRAGDRKSTRLNSSHITISYAVFCLKKKKKQQCHYKLTQKKKNKKK